MKSKINPTILFVTLAIVILGLGLLDAQVSREMTFFVLYLVPLGIGAYFLDLKFSVGLVAVTTSTWVISDYLTNPQYTHGSIFLWNVGVRSFAFCGLAFLIHHFRTLLERQREIIEEYKLAASNVRTLDGTHLLCDTCGRLASNDNRWLSPIEFITEKSQASLHSCICPTCLGKHKSDTEQK